MQTYMQTYITHISTVNSTYMCDCVCVSSLLISSKMIYQVNHGGVQRPSHQSVCTSPTRRVLTISPSPDPFVFVTLSRIRLSTGRTVSWVFKKKSRKTKSSPIFMCDTP